MPDEEAPLTDILGVDADGESMMYTTLYDNKGRVISTNDPNYTQNSFYANGGTVKRGDAIDVRFRIAKIIPNDEGGVREDITYYMGALPSELIPEETDEAGNLLLNPAVPIEFIQSGASDDTLRAWGGIYGAAQNWQVKMFSAGWKTVSIFPDRFNMVRS